MTKQHVRRWWLPALTVASMAIPLTLGACVDDLPPWYIPGCALCEECYGPLPAGYDDTFGTADDTTDTIGSDEDEGSVGGTPNELSFEGEVPPTYRMPEERAYPSKRPTGGKVPDGVLRPRIDPQLPKVPHEYRPPSPAGKQPYAGKSGKSQ